LCRKNNRHVLSGTIDGFSQTALPEFGRGGSYGCRYVTYLGKMDGFVQNRENLVGERKGGQICDTYNMKPKREQEKIFGNREGIKGDRGTDL
jgi:hypothetical protein